VYTTERYLRRGDAITYASTGYRAPMGDTWFLVGDGKRNPTPLEFDLHIRKTELRDAEAELNEVLTIIEDIETVRWGPYTRTILGPRGAIPTPAVGGYRLSVSLWPAGPTWTDDIGTPVQL